MGSFTTTDVQRLAALVLGILSCLTDGCSWVAQREWSGQAIGMLVELVLDPRGGCW